MANVETPTTFMSNYQASRQNKRDDRQDAQKELYSIYDEKRKRQDHKAKIDMDEETQRHRMTINPLTESIELYQNRKNWGTLDSDIERHHNKTDNDKHEGYLREDAMKSNLDWNIYTRGQRSSEYAKGGNRFNSAESDAQVVKRAKAMTIQDDQQDNAIKGLQLTEEELLRQGKDSKWETKVQKNYYDTADQNFDDDKKQIATQQYNNSFWNPLMMAGEGFDKERRGFELSKRQYGMQNRMFDLNDKSQEAISHFTEMRNSYLQDLSNTDKPMLKEEYLRKVEAMGLIDKYLQKMKVSGSADMSGMMGQLGPNGGLKG